MAERSLLAHLQDEGEEPLEVGPGVGARGEEAARLGPRAQHRPAERCVAGRGWWQSSAWSRIDCARSPFFWKQLRRLRTWRAHTSLTGTGVTISSDHGMP